MFPQIGFIFAHSLEGEGAYNSEGVALKILADKSRGLDNVYTEISIPYIGGHDLSLDPKYVEAWKYFGIDRVLFGSDIGFGDETEHDNLIDAFSRFSGLTAEEKNKILRLNSETMIKKYNL